MDIKKFDSKTNADKGMKFYLEEPTEKDKEGAGLILYGADSSVMKEKDREIQRRNREKKSPLTPEEIENQLFERLVAGTKGTFGKLKEGDKEFIHSPSEADRLYREYPDIADRASMFVYTRANFFPTASAT